ncbi:piercer of microtubule wall 2 protein [Colius striatus]|uniref:piercer of microtubule wall 2 protein n=1 Tax=Colius striatus TaxID=57412 RepID=UPI002B1D8134|nr:piercer of microtubule wall 2 protein [Colius striatus]
MWKVSPQLRFGIGRQWPCCYRRSCPSLPKSRLPLQGKKMTSARNLSSPNTEQNQSPHMPFCANPGNPVFSCMLDTKMLLTNGSLAKPQHLLFKTTSSEYGAIPPVSQMVPCTYHPVDQTFSKHLLACGPFGGGYLNTAIDRSRVYDYPNFQHTL